MMFIVIKYVTCRVLCLYWLLVCQLNEAIDSVF